MPILHEPWPTGTTTLSVAMTGRGARTLTPETPMFQAVKLLLDRGANVNAAGSNGATLLHQNLDRGRGVRALCLWSTERNWTSRMEAAERRSTSPWARRPRRPLLRQDAAEPRGAQPGPAARLPQPPLTPPPLRFCGGRLRRKLVEINKSQLRLRDPLPEALHLATRATTDSDAERRSLSRRRKRG
jgi:hypothetical protein